MSDSVSSTDLSAWFREMVATLEDHPEQLVPTISAAVSDEELFRHAPDLATVVVGDVEIAGPHGPISARSYVGSGPHTNAAIVWVHGGGFIAGDLSMPESHWVGLSLAARRVPVLAVDYRKALHGVHHPIPSDDVLAAWRWGTGDWAASIGVPPAALHLGGASAGANLTAGVALRLRDADEPAPASLVLIYGLFHPELPELDGDLSAAIERHPEVMHLTPAACRLFNENYVGDERALGDRYAFPGNGSLAGLPPCLLVHADADALRSSGQQFGRQLGDAGVDVVEVVEDDTVHGYLNTPFVPQADRTISRIVEWTGIER